MIIHFPSYIKIQSKSNFKEQRVGFCVIILIRGADRHALFICRHMVLSWRVGVPLRKVLELKINQEYCDHIKASRHFWNGYLREKKNLWVSISDHFSISHILWTVIFVFSAKKWSKKMRNEASSAVSLANTAPNDFGRDTERLENVHFETNCYRNLGTNMHVSTEDAQADPQMHTREVKRLFLFLRRSFFFAWVHHPARWQSIPSMRASVCVRSWRSENSVIP